ncbi:diguanylate cyclase/phosphodiesterase [Candidatus Magnetoovum chiemensis]|nr:diguanylate cyclase/phosphodiesterase [Candidatus Magnetoovum chiemensis]
MEKIEKNNNNLTVIDDVTDNDSRIIHEVINNNSLYVLFQPLYNSKDFSIYGYEALSRLDSGYSLDISSLFSKARFAGLVTLLDLKCRKNAIINASQMGISNKDAYLFINICPDSLMDPNNKHCATDTLIEQTGLKKEKIVLEITEESAIDNYDTFRKAVDCYRDKGYKVAIDDFGTGYAGLKMLYSLEPDYVKIDRHFISHIDNATIKYNLVDSILTACNKIGIKVVAEGIEREEELETVLSLGVEVLQGFWLQMPEPTLECKLSKDITIYTGDQEKACFNDYKSCVCSYSEPVQPISPLASAKTVLGIFSEDPHLRGLPVVEKEIVVGVINRTTFLENRLLGKYGYGMALNTYKNISSIMERKFVSVEYNIPLEDLAARIQADKCDYSYDIICVTKHGKYYGVLSLNVLLNAITTRNIMLARNSNPLTGLPGNDYIQREISSRLTQNLQFDVGYVDLDNFKPYNDNYGFERGDMVIKTVAEIIQKEIEEQGNPFNFVGHIGGDDFIIVARPQSSISICENVIAAFEKKLPEMHGIEDYQRGYYVSKNRKGETEQFDFLSLSIGVVSTEVNAIKSFPQLASVATEVKKAAKMHKGSCIVRDRRLLGHS